MRIRYSGLGYDMAIWSWKRVVVPSHLEESV
jgi:hypothetical protein